MLKRASFCTGVVLLGLVFSVMTGNPVNNGTSTVFAQEEYATEAATDIGVGMLGIEKGAEALQRYYEGVRDFSSEVGTQKDTFASSLSSVSGLGYTAMQTLNNNLTYTGDDYYTMLQIVEAEVTGGDIKSKMLVAGVVLNRVKDSHFPDSIREVVWENVGGSPQFSPTADGRMGTLTITDSTVEAVKRVMNGENISEGALFFFARDDSDAENVTWFDENLVRLYSYGGHEFFTFKNYTD